MDNKDTREYTMDDLEDIIREFGSDWLNEDLQKKESEKSAAVMLPKADEEALPEAEEAALQVIQEVSADLTGNEGNSSAVVNQVGSGTSVGSDLSGVVDAVLSGLDGDLGQLNSHTVGGPLAVLALNTNTKTTCLCVS